MPWFLGSITAETIRPALQIIKTKPGVSLVSSVFLMCLDTQVLVFGDCAIIPNPSPKELAEIATTSAQTAKQFNIAPKVALLSYATGNSAQGEMIDKIKEALTIAQKLDPQLEIDGPLQFDASIDKSVAKKKMPNSQVAGQASVFIFPDLNAGNIAYKAVQRSAKAVAIGPILQGLNKPINDLSRGALVEDIVNTVLISVIQAQD
ncbi:phosphate acetyltransferase [Helicobacter pylori]|nr:phosphate acetyltransferase [Helicobacter pylori]